MRYPADHREKTRERILTAAATVFRRQGFQAASVDTIMAEAGLTAGGFYAHFKSKEDLFAAAFRHSLEHASLLKSLATAGDSQAGGAKSEDRQTANSQTGNSLTGAANAKQHLRTMAGRYLSLAHRRMIDTGCPLPPLLAELPRQDANTRELFEQILEEAAAGMQARLASGGTASSDQPLAVLALMVGGLTLARAVESPQSAERILSACRKLVEQALGGAESAPESNTSRTTAQRPSSSVRRNRSNKKGPSRS